ncbi:MAG TPA: glycosyltransferase family 2 protein [Chloroflexia bacterium]|nr:glycosyltransferase family 2 protein [Chloroflexia bacterium]
MNDLAILIPTYKRADRLAAVCENIHATTKRPHTIYFIVEPEDTETLEICQAIRENFILNGFPHTYVNAINTGYQKTQEKFIFCGADDLSFTEGWDEKVLTCFTANPKAGMVGVKDSWPITKTGKHASHFCVSREYIQKFSGVEDEANVIYSSLYYHLMCDIETEQTAMKRNAFLMSEGVVNHLHWFMGQAKKDATYDRAMLCQRHDEEVYTQRRHRFEQYLFEELFNGKVYRVNQGKLSVVLASFNQLDYLKKTIESLLATTYHPMELIIVDNGSDERTFAYINSLYFPTTDRVQLKRIKSDPNRFVTHTWNTGIKAATGDYIAVINNDITFSKFWDVYLMNSLLDAEVLLANPYQKDDGEPTPYGKAARAGDIDIRGTCFMFRKGFMESIGYLPEQLKIWFSDSWLAWMVTKKLNKQSVFVPEAVVHHYGSKSSLDYEARSGNYWWVIRGDAYAYKELTGENVEKYLQLVEAKAKK